MISRLYYDYYNNGWGNDKQPEVSYLEKYENQIKPFLKEKNSLNELIKLWRKFWVLINTKHDEDDEDDEDMYEQEDFLDKNEKNIMKWLEDVTNAIILLIKDKEK